MIPDVELGGAAAELFAGADRGECDGAGVGARSTRRLFDSGSSCERMIS
jgi:hypothetical protein